MRPAARIGAIDGLRGVAAVTVAIVFHYRHFNVADAMVDAPFLMAIPLNWLQRYGWLGVDLFFVLSGYIMTWKYVDAIGEGKLTGANFLVLRASRLYPVYLLTLAIVGIEAWIFYATFDSFPSHAQYNDTYHFVLSLFFMQNIGLEMGHSFNFPAWSRRIAPGGLPVADVPAQTREFTVIGASVAAFAITAIFAQGRTGLRKK